MVQKIVENVLATYQCEDAAIRLQNHLRLQKLHVRKGCYLHAALLHDFATDLACGAEATSMEEFYQIRFAKLGQGKVIWRRLTQSSADMLLQKGLSGMRMVIVEDPADLGEVWNPNGGEEKPYQILRPYFAFDAIAEDGTKAGGY